jgi:hypothetical protein
VKLGEERRGDGKQELKIEEKTKKVTREESKEVR